MKRNVLYRIAPTLSVVVASILLTAASCQGRNVVTLTGQSGLAVAQSIAEIQKATEGLVEQKVLTPEQGIAVLEKLMVVNKEVEQLPPLLRTLDVNNPDLSTVDKAIAILEGASQNLSVVIGGVPLSQVTDPLVALIRAAQKTVTTALVEIARLKGE